MSNYEDDENPRAAQAQQCLRHIQRAEAEFDERQHGRNLSEACYTFSELGLFDGLGSINSADTIRIWALVESVKRDGFPEQLWM